MNLLIFFCFFLLSCIAHLSRCSDNSTYSFEIVNKSTWLNIAERIFKGDAPFNFTIIPYNYVNNSTKENNNNNNKDSVLLISKNLKNSSNPVDENSNIIDGTKTNTSNNNSSNIVGIYESEVNEEKIKEDNTHESNINKKENEIVINSNHQIPISNIFSKNIDHNKKYIESDYKSTHTNNPELIHSTDFIGSNNNHTFNFLSRYNNSVLNNMQGNAKIPGSVPEFKARIFSEEENNEIESAENNHMNSLNPNEPCDKIIKLGDIINSVNEKTISINFTVNNVLCINLDSVKGNGFVWTLLGVHKKKPLIDPSNFPTKRVTQSYVSPDISVTNPVPIPKNSNSNKDDSINNKQHESDNNTTKNHFPKAREQLVGGSSMLISKIKPHNPGQYFIVYSYYRPFDPTRDTNTRIIELNVQ